MEEKLKEYEYNAVSLFRNCQEGILSTVSKLHEGYPFGSFVTFISGNSRNIYFYISDLAQHTKNISFESKSCLTLSRLTKKDDKQNSERLTIVGDITVVEGDLINYCKERFFKHFPQSRSYSNFHDFKFYKMKISHVRWIGGFGKIAWLTTKNWKDSQIEWASKENNIIDHMNKDHRKNISSALNFQHEIEDKNVKMIFLTIDGYYIESNKKIYFIQFPYPAYSSDQYREILVAQAKEYRSFEIK